MPSNAVLPPHNGIIITRSLQEWACLLPQDLSFAAVARLLGWHTHEAQVLSDTTIRTIVRTHGHIIRQAEQAQVAALLQHDDLTAADLLVIPHNQPRRCAGWPEELNAAVDTALAAEQVCPPDGVSWADWVEFWRLAVRRTPFWWKTCATWDRSWRRIRCWSQWTKSSHANPNRTIIGNCVRRAWSRRRGIADFAAWGAHTGAAIDHGGARPPRSQLPAADC